MPRIFISYRRSDSAQAAGRIHDRLVNAFGGKSVFKDVDDIPFGHDFTKIIDREMTAADIVLVIMGRHWADVRDEEGQRRLDDPGDFVRIEVEAALAHPDLAVIPVLVDGAKMPKPASLPPSLQALTLRNAAVVRDDPDFHRDVDRLIEAIRRSSRTAARSLPVKRSSWLAMAGVLALLLLIAAGVLLSGLLDGDDNDNDREETEAAEAASTTDQLENDVTDLPAETPADSLSITNTPPVASTDEAAPACEDVADGYDSPVGTQAERRSDLVWPGDWVDAVGFANLYMEGTPIEAYSTGADLVLNDPFDHELDKPVYAVADGTVTFAGEMPGWDWVVIIRHDPLQTCDGTVTYSRYSQLNDVVVTVGDRVLRGDYIAGLGKSDATSGYFLSFDLSTTTVLEAVPGHWPGMKRDEVLEHYTDPREFIANNRPSE